MPSPDDRDPTEARSDHRARAHRPHLLDWQEQIYASPGRRAVTFLDYLGRISYVFQGNIAQYNNLLTGLQDPGRALPILSNPDQHDALLSEAERLLHNILAALSTRVEQQRVFVRDYLATEDEGLSGEYLAKVSAEFAQDAPSQFLKRLRNLLTHNRLPVAQSHEVYSEGGFSVTFVLPTGPLLQRDAWNAELRTWIQAQGDKIMIVDIVNEYARKCRDFDAWLQDRVRVKYAAEIQKYREVAEAFNRERKIQFGL